jgi:hypothetical protein
MGIDAVALLKGKDVTVPQGLTTKTLDDATLVHTKVDFSSEPAELADALQAQLGDALDAHDDERGVFVLPHVAAPKATSYQGVIDEVGELGMWVETSQAPAQALGGAPDLGAFGALVSELMQSLSPETIAEMQRAVMTGDMAALARVQAQVTAALGGEAAVAARSQELARAAQEGASKLGGLGLDLDALRRAAGDPPDEDK